MAINITNNYTNPQVTVMNKFHNAYKKNVDEKVAMPKNNAKDHISDENVNKISSDIREFLSIDEKKVLKEVFGDSNVEKNISSPYNSTRYSDFLKGSQIDIRL
ncbi:MAG: hypothetical protein FWG98_01575 [Candidatus Cloacimonetes bacterium]|nr:hypothetical protein [Candidatus Cloacimonadota bacterium]